MDVVAHRGLTDAAPENSLASVGRALAAGLRFVEVDVRLSRDGHPFLLHDATLERTTDCAGRLAELNADQAARALLVDRTPLPRLEAALPLCERRATLCLDVKEAHAGDAILRALHGRTGPVEVWSTHERVLLTCAGLGLRTALISDGVLPKGIGDFIWRAQDCGASSLSFYPADIEPHIAAACRHAAMPFLSGTPNDEATWDYLLHAGARGIITDRPLDCVRWLTHLPHPV